MEVKAHLDWTPVGQVHWVVAGTARGDLNALTIVAQAESPFRGSFNGRALDLTDRWHWVGEAQVQDFDLQAWGVRGPFGRITARLAASGDDAGFNAHGPVDPTGLHAGLFEAQFSGSYANRVLTAKHVELRQLASGAVARGAGTIGIDGPRLDLSGEVSDFRWPLVGRDPAVSGATGSFTLAGVLPYRVRLSGSAQVAGLAPIPADVSGTLGPDSFAFDGAEIDLFGGHASVSGEVVWSPAQSWSVVGHARGINPGALRADLPGSVSFMLGASGRGFDTKGDLTASFSDLSGKLRGVAASGSGTLTRAGNTWGFSQVRVGLGSARVALDGHINERMDLRFAVSAEDLSLLAPGIRGELKASGTVGGTLADPVIVATAHGGDLDYQGVKLESVDANVNFDPGASGRESKIDARLRKLSYQDRALESVTLTLSGPPAAYQVQLAVAATGLTASAAARGAYAHGTFTGALNALTINGSESLHLSLERPVGLTAAPDHVRLEWLCLVGTPGSMCADGEWSAAAWFTTVMTNQLPLNTLTAGMTPAVEYLGTVTALAHLSGGADTPLVGTLRAELTGAELAHKLASHRIEHTRIGSGTVTLNATPALVSAQADLGDGEVGTLHGRLEARRTTAQGTALARGTAQVATPARGTSPGEPQAHWQDMPLSGELHAQTAELGLVSLYEPDIDRAAGHFNADVRLAGTAGMPQLS